jgi:hypothetical protein
MRVGVIQRSTADTVYLLGYGNYIGHHKHPALGILNPYIKLDDGTEVWGCECWWGPEEEIKASIGDRKVVMVKND